MVDAAPPAGPKKKVLPKLAGATAGSAAKKKTAKVATAGRPPAKRPTANKTAAKATGPLGVVVLGNQLFAHASWPQNEVAGVFMREDFELCTYFRFHQQKIAFFLAAMRCHADALRAQRLAVHYEPLTRDAKTYEDALVAWAHANQFRRLAMFEIEDKFFEARLHARLQAEKIALEVWPSPMFLTSRGNFAAYLERVSRPFMKTFYESQRRRLRLLVDVDGGPVGGRWSYDEDNRQPLPAHVEVPEVPHIAHNAHVTDVVALCRTHFAGHPGDAGGLWLPVDRARALGWLRDFLQRRLAQFGPYEDALTERTDTVFHGVLSPLLNVGLLTPDEVVRAALEAGRKQQVPLQSLEGFLRQVVGWREFIRGIYQNFDDVQRERNHFGHTRRLSDAWARADTGVPPLDAVLDKVQRLGWAHHIERLMVLGSMMLLLEVEPKEAHRWFMEMFVDSSDWVMGPNVYGMGLHSDGGIFATKPYFCGSNYYRKMGGYPKGAWCDGVDGLYWRFVARNRAAFANNFRLRNVARGLDRISPQRRAHIEAAAQVLQDRLTVAP